MRWIHRIGNNAVGSVALRAHSGRRISPCAGVAAHSFSASCAAAAAPPSAPSVTWSAGDVLALPGAPEVIHAASEDTVAWLVTDEPALAFQNWHPCP